MASSEVYDCIVVGAGHNGLVCAFELARAGRRVLVLERRHVVGGCAVTEALWPGYRISTAAYVVSLLVPEVEQRMELARHGYRVLARNPSSFTPMEDGRYLLLGADEELNRREIAKFSARDAKAWPRFNALLSRVAECLEPMLTKPPPNLMALVGPARRTTRPSSLLRETAATLGVARSFAKLGRSFPQAMELLTGAARPILDRWFESDVLKATLATDAIIGTFQPPSARGTAYVLLHHVMGAAGGARGVWGYVEGGMGGLTQAMARACEEAGVEIRTNAEVESIRAEDGAVRGVVLAGGESIDARTVVSGVDCRVTFEKLVGEARLPGDFVAAVRRIDYASASMKINLAVRELPDFSCMPGKEVGPQHRGTIHIGCTLDLLERAYDDAKRGRPSEKPVIEMTIPSSVDRTLAPDGHHVISLFVQYAPYRLAEGSWDDVKERFANRCVEEITSYAPDFAGSIVHRQVLSPVDLERIFGLTGGNIFQGAMSLNQLFSLRPLAGWSDYRTPVRGLYLCGSATHPGGGVTGACGLNAARAILQ